jgi:hypothetical protein
MEKLLERFKEEITITNGKAEQTLNNLDAVSTCQSNMYTYKYIIL